MKKKNLPVRRADFILFSVSEKFRKLRVDWNVLSPPDMLLLSGFNHVNRPDSRQMFLKGVNTIRQINTKVSHRLYLIISANGEAIFECRHERTGTRHPTKKSTAVSDFRSFSPSFRLERTCNRQHSLPFIPTAPNAIREIQSVRRNASVAKQVHLVIGLLRPSNHCSSPPAQHPQHAGLRGDVYGVLGVI